ncbi:MAG: secondary thiamine-phosphate synthase enzyme YjbQ [Pseudomonadota bacterium]
MSGQITTFTVQTDGAGLYEFTDGPMRWLEELQPGDGLLTLMIRHTSASILIQENADPQVQTDLQNWVQRFAPRSDDPSMSYLKHTYEGTDDMPGHIRSSHLPVSLSIPVSEGKMMLGQWQALYLWEHRDAPRERYVAAHFA